MNGVYRFTGGITIVKDYIFAIKQRQREDPGLLADLGDFQASELLPGFAAANLETQAHTYIAETIERFANPFLDHYFRDIIDGHVQKVESRAGGFLEWARDSGDRSVKPRLTKLYENRIRARRSE